MFLKDCVTSAEMLAPPNEAFGLCEISIEALLSAGVTKVTYEPSWGFGHCGVWGLKPKVDGKGTHGRRRNVAKAVQIVEWPAFARELASRLTSS